MLTVHNMLREATIIEDYHHENHYNGAALPGPPTPSLCTHTATRDAKTAPLRQFGLLLLLVLLAHLHKYTHTQRSLCFHFGPQLFARLAKLVTVSNEQRTKCTAFIKESKLRWLMKGF